MEKGSDLQLAGMAPDEMAGQARPQRAADIQVALLGGLFGSLPIFFGGIINTLMVAALITFRRPEPPFLLWLALETLVCASRIVVLTSARRALAGKPTHTDLRGAGALLGAERGLRHLHQPAQRRRIAATLACLSAASMVGGICVRNSARRACRRRWSH